ncbi:MAG: CHAT domain-containing protein, partial [Acidobacteria bacterium]|nr:CHAT domain-containing protein [Acidobacteriota bacterium]
LANEKRNFQAFLELLEQGRSSRLGQEEPQLRGVPEGVPEVPEPLLLPDGEDLTAAALGFVPRLPGQARTAEVLRVVVTHGSLSFAKGPVAVGHYERDLIVGAEAYLDKTLEGALSRGHDLGLYPGAEGTGEAILHPRDPGRGALVVGLGAIGDLAPAKISRGIRQAVLRYATLVASLGSWPFVAADGRRVLRITSLLIGTGQGTGLSVDDSLLAGIQGVNDAVELLQKVLGSSAPKIEQLEFIELYEHRAVCACEALSRVAAAARLRGQLILEVEPLLQRVDGGQTDIPCGGSAWYRRLQIVEDPAPAGAQDPEAGFRALKFTYLTDRARAEVRLQPTQRRLVDRFVQHSIASSAWRRSAARTLFELLVPNELKEYAPDDLDLLLVLDRHSAGYPWELMSDDGDDLGECQPLSVRAGMLRQLASGSFRERPVSPLESTALVIGDPPTGSPRFPPLSGARREAQLVADVLRNQGYSVGEQIGTVPENIISALFDAPYRLLHIAAHGTYDRERPEASGVVLAEGMLLTAAEIGQLRQVPELAFINCCHLGRIEDPAPEAVGHRNLLAANLGLKLIEIGVRAVVVAGWTVDDRAAETFARVFYEELFAGEDFGRAVKSARQATYRLYPDTNTWGAYQCYGDPAFRLLPRRKAWEYRAPSWVSPVRPVQDLMNIRSRARTGSRAAELRREVEAIEATLTQSYPEWMRLGRVREALGRAWAELADLTAWDLGGSSGEAKPRDLPAFDRAVESLRAALLCEDGEVSLDVRGELTTLEVRGETVSWRHRHRELGERRRDLERSLRALEAEDASGAGPRFQELKDALAALEVESAAIDDRAAKRIGGHLEVLKGQVAKDATARRWTMAGSAAKRMAAVCGSSRLKAVEEACEFYGRACELSRATCGVVAPYPGGNWTLLKVVLRLADGNK